MAKTALNPASAYPSPNPRSCGTLRSGLLCTAGQVALDSKGELIGAGDIRAQTRQALTNIRDILAEGGATFADVMKVTIFLSRMEDKDGMNEVYAEFFGADLPARTTVGVTLGSPEVLIEIEAVAVVAG